MYPNSSGKEKGKGTVPALYIPIWRLRRLLTEFHEQRENESGPGGTGLSSLNLPMLFSPLESAGIDSSASPTRLFPTHRSVLKGVRFVSKRGQRKRHRWIERKIDTKL